MTREDAIKHIEAMFPPDSQYADTREVGRNLMDCWVGNPVGYRYWRDLGTPELIRLAKANLEEGGENPNNY